MTYENHAIKKQRFFNQIKLTKEDDLCICIDVHKATYHVALYLNGGHAIDFITPADNIKICTTLKKLEPAIKNIVYEAGPTGYSRARQLPRLRIQFVKKLKQTKLQIKSFLLQHGISEPQSLRYWSQLAIEKLNKLQLLDSLRYTLDMLVTEYKFLNEKIEDIDRKLEETFAKTTHAKKIQIL